MKCAPDRWYPIGVALGYTEGELNSMVNGISLDADKLLRIVNHKAMAVDKQVLAGQLLHACGMIHKPVITAVQAQIQVLQSNSK